MPFGRALRYLHSADVEKRHCGGSFGSGDQACSTTVVMGLGLRELMHELRTVYYECVAPNVDINLQSGRF